MPEISFDRSRQPDHPQSFGYKIAWYAMKSPDSRQLVDLLPLENVEVANWETGTNEAYEVGGKVFVTPPLNDWVLVVGLDLMPLNGLKAEIEPRLLQLGKISSEAQFFFTYRIVEMHGWARVIGGKLIRGYSYLGESGETLWDEGDVSTEERELELFSNTEYFPNEEDVIRLAERWSLNPCLIESQFTEPSLGYAGSLGL